MAEATKTDGDKKSTPFTSNPVVAAAMSGTVPFSMGVTDKKEDSSEDGVRPAGRDGQGRAHTPRVPQGNFKFDPTASGDWGSTFAKSKTNDKAQPVPQFGGAGPSANGSTTSGAGGRNTPHERDSGVQGRGGGSSAATGGQTSGIERGPAGDAGGTLRRGDSIGAACVPDTPFVPLHHLTMAYQPNLLLPLHLLSPQGMMWE